MSEVVLGVFFLGAAVVLLGQFLRDDLSADGQCDHDILELVEARHLRRAGKLHPASLFAQHLAQHEYEGDDDA